MKKSTPSVFAIIANIILMLAFAFDIYLLFSSVTALIDSKNSSGWEGAGHGIGAAILLVLFFILFFAILVLSFIKWIFFMIRSSRYRGKGRTWLLQLPFFAAGAIACLVLYLIFGYLFTDNSPLMLLPFILASGALFTFCFSDIDFWSFPFRKKKAVQATADSSTEATAQAEQTNSDGK